VNYIIRRPSVDDAILTASFIAATVIAAVNLPALVAAVFIINAVFIVGERALSMRARWRAFKAIGAAQHLPLGVSAIALVIPVRERAL
jgi:hypothetical protein